MKQIYSEYGNSQVGERAEDNSTQNEKERQQSGIPSFQDVWKTGDIGETKLLADFLDVELIVERYDQFDGDYGPYVILATKVDGENRRLRTSSKTITDQLARIIDKLPMKARVVKKMGKNGKAYFSFA